MTDRSLSGHLRTHTRAAHTRAEQSLGIMTPGTTIEQVCDLLLRWLGFHRAWEPIATAHFESSFWQGREKCPAIERDLADLGVATEPPGFDIESLELHRPGAMIGTLYVTEGATLGGQYIAKHLQSQLDLRQGLTFLRVYEPQTMMRWSQTQALIDASRACPADATAAACRTFDALASWLPGRIDRVPRRA